MGLCKCPRRQVTPLFCYEHRLNVCQHCLVEKHAQCVVKSYKEWLDDSDYDPTCPLCKNVLRDCAPDDVIRLECLHVYHFACVYQWGAAHPANTAPAGFQCPICRAPVIPSPQSASPVAKQCREKLQSCNWARQGLGLPFLPELDQMAPRVPEPPAKTDDQQSYANGGFVDDVDYSRFGVESRKFTDDATTHLLMGDAASSPDRDTGAEKYKRRPAGEWLRRFLKSRSIGTTVGRCRARSIFWVLFVLLALLTLLAIGSRLRSPTDDYDPMLDPLANPNIRIRQERDGGSHL